MVCVDDPVVRTCTRGDYPVHVKLQSVKNGVRGIVKVRTSNGHGIWDVDRYPLRSNPDVYTLKVLRYNAKADSNFYCNVT